MTLKNLWLPRLTESGGSYLEAAAEGPVRAPLVLRWEQAV